MFPIWEMACKKLEEYLDKADYENIWPTFKEYIYSVSSEFLGFVEWEPGDWFNEIDAVIV